MGKGAAILVAGGRGARAGGELPKQFQTLAGRPVVWWSAKALRDAGVAPIVVVAPADGLDLCRAALAGLDEVQIVAGGESRTHSVRNGLAALDPAAEVVLIHDAARPGLSPSMVAALIAAIEAGADGAAPALGVADSLRRADPNGDVIGEVEREGLMRVQTPQAFRAELIRRAYASSSNDFSDDIAIARTIGARVRLIPGEARLMKLTYAEDFTMLDAMMNAQGTVCVGTGFDAHRFDEGDHVTLCGVRIAHTRGLKGHSDADAGWHALVDAILGALGEGDIGSHFPPTDPQWKGADSERFLRHAATLAAGRGASISHVDVTLVCERPKVGPHREAMRARTAEVLGLPLSRVSVKATTTERMGFLGREEGLAAQASATLLRWD